MYLTVFRLTF